MTAVEMGATVTVRFKRHAGVANKRKFQAPIFTREDYFIDPKFAAPQRFLGVMGMPLRPDCENEGENLTLACRNEESVRSLSQGVEQASRSQE